MMIKFVRFNIYLSMALCLVLLVGGCLSSKEKKKKFSMMEMHLEVKDDGTDFSQTVPIFREHPVAITVEKEAFVDTADLEKASVVEDLGGFKIQFSLNWHGTQVLNGITASNRGKRIVIMCAFPETRWLAAPVIHNQISNGTFSFTPDCSREEADRIVSGLNAMAKEVKDKDKF